jgi:hypothetical protein
VAGSAVDGIVAADRLVTTGNGGQWADGQQARKAEWGSMKEI